MLGQEKYFGTYYIGEFANGGNLGVDLFFVISGFIMFHITDGFSRATNSEEFLRRRFFRIVPFMWLSIIVVYLLRSTVRGGIDPVPFIRGFFLWPVGDLDPNPVWTLRHELFFYLCTYLCLAFRRGYLILAGFLILPLPILFLKTATPVLDNELIENFFHARANTSFAMGVFLGWGYRNHSIKHGSRIGNIAVLTAAIALLCFEYVVPSRIGIGKVTDTSMNEAFTIDTTSVSIAAKYLLTTLACGLIVYGSLACVDGKNLAQRIGLTLGNASYSIYLTHETVISFVGIAFVKMKWTDYAALAGSFAILAALVFGVVVHFFVEKPLIRSMRYWSSGCSSVAPRH